MSKVRIFAIDTGKTKRNVESWLHELLQFKQIVQIRREAKLTASYGNLAGGCSTGAVSRQTEDIAVWNADYERQMQQQEQLLGAALGTLEDDEREIIEDRYLASVYVNDAEVMEKLSLAEE